MNDRFKKIREELGFSQEKFGELIGLSKSGISNIESGQRNVTDKHIKLLSSELSINENWIRTGEGEMFNSSDEFSLDEYAKQKNISDLDLKIIKGFLDLDPEVRKIVVSTFRNALSEDKAEVREKSDSIIKTIESNQTEENTKPYRIQEVAQEACLPSAAEGEKEYLTKSDIDVEVESYRKELEDERQNKRSSVLPDSSEKLG